VSPKLYPVPAVEAVIATGAPASIESLNVAPVPLPFVEKVAFVRSYAVAPSIDPVKSEPASTPAANKAAALVAISAPVPVFNLNHLRC